MISLFLPSIQISFLFSVFTTQIDVLYHKLYICLHSEGVIVLGCFCNSIICFSIQSNSSFYSPGKRKKTNKQENNTTSVYRGKGEKKNTNNREAQFDAETLRVRESSISQGQIILSNTRGLSHHLNCTQLLLAGAG